ncbi:MAG: YceH family protein [Pseudomonadota bacterium]|nr:YceH family protein [Pseudomonadota bacterium]MDP1903904.1 YceH family protein [Pseudomonadota bacterium]MDP2351143.1 YceH family protein [Pseudomonadota bacterium]
MTPLTAEEARVLGVLIEKSKVTPDAYPLTVNSLAAGCNQKTSRDPVMALSEAEVQATLEELRGRTLIMESYGASGRVLRYAHNFGKVYGLPGAAVDLLAVLALRGPQTASELRANCERLHHFADASAVEGYLDELASREAGALTLKLPRQPGAREQRWTHLLCGEPVELPTALPPAAASSDLEARVAQLEQEVAELRAALEKLVD